MGGFLASEIPSLFLPQCREWEEEEEEDEEETEFLRMLSEGPVME